MGQIAGLASTSGSDEKTQFQKEVDSFIRIISCVAIAIGARLPASEPSTNGWGQPCAASQHGLAAGRQPSVCRRPLRARAPSQSHSNTRARIPQPPPHAGVTFVLIGVFVAKATVIEMIVFAIGERAAAGQLCCLLPLPWRSEASRSR